MCKDVLLFQVEFVGDSAQEILMDFCLLCEVFSWPCCDLWLLLLCNLYAVNWQE